MADTLSCQWETLHSQQLRSIKKSIDSDHGIYRAAAIVGQEKNRNARRRCCVRAPKRKSVPCSMMLRTACCQEYGRDRPRQGPIPDAAGGIVDGIARPTSARGLSTHYAPGKRQKVLRRGSQEE